jgi:hypothetical protein
MSDKELLNLISQECRRRVAPQLHLSGDFRHYISPDSGWVCCFHADKEPDGWLPSSSQTEINFRLGLYVSGSVKEYLEDRP